MRKADGKHYPIARGCAPRRDGTSRGHVRIEVFLGFLVLGLAVLGAGFAAVTGYGVVRSEQHDQRASRAAAAAAAEFETAAMADFDAALAAFQGRDRRDGDMRVRCAIVLDETAFETPVDLNGDGDRLDTELLPEECQAGYLRTTVTFADGASLSFLCIALRGNYHDGSVSQDIVVRDAYVTPGRLRADLELARKIEIVGVRVAASVECRVVSVRINGRSVVAGDNWTVTPFALAAGMNEIDEICLVADGDVTGMEPYRVTFVESTGAELDFVLQNRKAAGSSFGRASPAR